MSHIFVHSERIIQARPEEVFHALTDYVNKRPRMLPDNFVDYHVEQGGLGHGTIVGYRFRAAGRERPYTMRAEETIKGQVLSERDAGSSFVTRWSVVPVAQGQQSKVSVESDWEGSGGMGGFFERTFAPMGLRKVYNRMLKTLEQLMKIEAPHEKKIMLADKQQMKIGTTSMLVGLGAALGIVLGFNYWLNRQGMRV